jgi:hypothetical protein
MKLVGWVERKRYPSVAVWKNDGFRESAQPIIYYCKVWRQPWQECGVTVRITPTVVVGGFVIPKLPNLL